MSSMAPNKTIIYISRATSNVIDELKIRDEICNRTKMQDFPMSKYFIIGMKLRHHDSNNDDACEEAYKRGAEIVGCMWCMYAYAQLQISTYNRYHVAFPWFLECAIRGHTTSIQSIFHFYGSNLHELSVNGLPHFWGNMVCSAFNDFEKADESSREAERTMMKNTEESIQMECNICGTTNLPENHICSGCEYYSYCCKAHQLEDWIEKDHRCLCRQLGMLKKHYTRKIAKEIKRAITNDVDPKTIECLQTIRTALGLNRPKAEYEHLVQQYDDKYSLNDVHSDAERYKCIMGRTRDGTVQIGSTPNLI